MDDNMEETSPLLRDKNSINDDCEKEYSELTGCGGSALCNPYKALHRFVALVFMCFLGFGSYFCYDSPGALQPQIKSDMNVNTENYMLLYAWYSWPNVILCFFGGFLIDRVFGIRIGAIVFAGFVTLGQVVVAAGALLNHYWLMVFGRFVFGIGGESLAVAQNTYAVSWFKGKELNMVFGLQLSFARVGSTVNFNVMKPIYDWAAKTYHGHQLLGMVLMLAVTTCLLSLFCATVLGFLDKRSERILKRKSAETGDVIHFKDILKFPLTFWLLSIICVAYYVAIFPFIGLGVEFFLRKYGFESKNANAVNSLVYIISAAASPVLGFAIDKIGRNLTWLFISVVIALFSHGLLAFTFLNPYIAMTFLGISYSMFASALWPLVAFIIPEYQLGTAYGIMQSVQNLGLAVFSEVAGIIVDNNGYLVLEVFFLAWLCMAIIAIVVLWIFDGYRPQLNLSVKQREEQNRQKEEAEALEREKLYASGSMADVTPQDLLQSRSSDFTIRNRYLSRLGAPDEDGPEGEEQKSKVDVNSDEPIQPKA